MTMYEHEAHGIPGYSEATEAYERELPRAQGTEVHRRAQAYWEAARYCLSTFGENSPQAAAALYYLYSWMKPLSADRSILAALALLKAEEACFGRLSGDMQGTLVNLALALNDGMKRSMEDMLLAAEVTTRLTSALATYLGGDPSQAELNFGHCLYQARRCRRAAHWLSLGMRRPGASQRRREGAGHVIARALFRAGAYNAAVVASREAIADLEAKPPETDAELSSAYFYFGKIRQAQGRLEEALALVRRCDGLEARGGYYDEDSEERVMTRRFIGELEELIEAGEGSEPQDTQLPDLASEEEDLDVLDLLPEFFHLLETDPRQAAALTPPGTMERLVCDAAQLQRNFSPARFDEILDGLLSLLGLWGYRADTLLDALRDEPPVKSAPPIDWDGNDSLLVASASRLADDLESRLGVYPDRMLATLVHSLQEALATLSVKPYWWPVEFDESALTDERRDLLITLLVQAHARARQVLVGNPYVEIGLLCEAHSMGEDLRALPSNGLRMCIDLQDMFGPREVLLAELREIHRFPRTTALVLFGNDLSTEELDVVPFDGLKELAKVDLAQNQLRRLPEGLARSRSLQYLSLWQNPELTFTADDVEWPALWFLDIRRTSVTEETLARLIERHPDAVIISGPRFK